MLDGAGTFSMMVSSSSGTPLPDLPLTAIMSMASSPKVFSICSMVSMGRASGRSILVTAGMILLAWTRASYVCGPAVSPNRAP